MPSDPRDAETTVAELRDLVRRFVDERDWSRFHDAKNLAGAISIEAAELQEIFQWIRSDELGRRLAEPGVRERVEEELADVLAYAISLANALDLDLTTALRSKMERNSAKYPAERFHGRWRPSSPDDDSDAP